MLDKKEYVREILECNQFETCLLEYLFLNAYPKKFKRGDSSKFFKYVDDDGVLNLDAAVYGEELRMDLHKFFSKTIPNIRCKYCQEIRDFCDCDKFLPYIKLIPRSKKCIN